MTQKNLQQKRILIIDDDEDDYFITGDYIRDIPGKNFIIDWCPRYEEALRKILSREYDLYLIDYRLGAHTGLDLIRNAISHHCDEPLILLTGKGNPKIDLEAMQVGATDYLVKTELNTEKLERCIRYALERYESMKALRHNERKYRNIFERSRDAVFLTSEDLRLKDLNDGMVLLLGYPKSELLQLLLTDLLEEETDKVYLENQLRSEGEVNDWETVLLNKEGHKLHCIISGSMEHDEYEGSYIQGIIHDITDLKKAEKITLQAEKLAAAGRLIRTLAHEVRNPLNNINLSAEQMFVDTNDVEQKLYLEIIQRNSNRIAALITELLNSFRPTDIVFAPSNLVTIVEQTLLAARDRLSLKKIKLVHSFPSEAMHMQADADKLCLALLNIVINAIEAMDEDNGELSITLEEQTFQHLVVIQDNGCGINSEGLSRLFEPYFTSKRNGMGLGLAATLNIVQVHKGSIDVRSEEKKGTTFSLFFPKL